MEQAGKNATKINNLIVRDIANNLKGIPSDYRILEISCGRGFLSKQLLDLGYNVTCTNFNSRPLFDDLKCDMVDLNKGLPYPDNSFDAIICVEVVEHVPNVVSVLKEFKRALKKDGLCIITTPNILNLYSRLRFLLSGFVKAYSSPYRLKVEIPDAHINQLSYPEFEYLAAKTGFMIREVNTWKIGLRSLLLSPILISPIMLYTWFSLFKERPHHIEFGCESPAEKKRNWAIYKRLLSRPLLLGENLEFIMLSSE